ncbi:MAG: TonB-dependent receptor, partial [Pseudomonadota bacterium]
ANLLAAATAQTVANEDGEEATRLDVVVVTALKQEVEQIELPVSVTVIDGANEATSSLDAGAALTRQTPNFTFTGFGQPGTDFVNLRGVGILGQPTNSLDNTVGFATNSVPTSAFGFAPTLLDIERVEVLRGPQGTLFGRNALGGLVNIVTRPADGEHEFTLRGEIGDDGYHLVEGVAAGWLSEGVLAGRIAARYQAQDGDIPNAVVGGTEGGVDLGAVRASLQFTPSDDLAINLVTSYDQDIRRSNYQLYREAEGFPISGADIIPRNERQRFETTLKAEKDFDGFRLTSQTNYQDISLEGRNDVGEEFLLEAAFGFVPPAGADLTINDDSERIFNQEFRLNSLPGSDISWVAGVSYFHSNYESNRDQVSSFSPFSSGIFDTDITAETVAAFADITLPVAEKLEFSGGLRVASDDQELSVDYTGRGFPGSVDAYSGEQELSDTYVTGRAVLNYAWSDDLRTYVSFSRGYASGGFERNTLNAAIGQPARSFRPATIFAYEAGLKSRTWDDRFDFSAALFYNDVTDGQLIVFDVTQRPTVFNFVNQDYETYGFELEGRAQLSDQLRLKAGIGITESELGDVSVSQQFDPGVEEGNQVPNSPLFNAFFNADYQFNDKAYIGGQYEYVAEREADISNSYQLSEYDIVNARVGYKFQGVEFYAFGRNLFDERPEYFAATFGADVRSIVIGPGRSYGIGISASF